MEYLHAIDIVHRDLKPQNILLNEKFEAKIADLGIAKLLENRESTKNMTFACTPRYVAREAVFE